MGGLKDHVSLAPRAHRPQKARVFRTSASAFGWFGFDPTILCLKACLLATSRLIITPNMLAPLQRSSRRGQWPIPLPPALPQLLSMFHICVHKAYKKPTLVNTV
ncbi:hypothetical protein SNOG_16183 [Parastagonospora nodorum SN15]|uniref:Uncharacterized protein n=1 Tax=Phaeosphaeria nodorum (strain SN15 / ATCC MYA-4574 / FGSC 10173) TaxID=321614 RepID=Q0TW67_PHANO|nr:hypothetical protein SNOG_16183 [Parastagonospora nodorum SN15]EAT76367.1 hypothetical protein SNOG_16183 [Parastagonospora nodorum SN15]